MNWKITQSIIFLLKFEIGEWATMPKNDGAGGMQKVNK
jgi:hypothetical protein